MTTWISNDRQVLEPIPIHDRVKDVKELNDTKDALPIGRALGASWLVKTDTSGFKISVKETPCTRRRLLSVVSVISDPLRMADYFLSCLLYWSSTPCG